ncbi:hypothetical protein LKD70_14905 [Ruminococcus sp. CLA-AA-H200]|uniref:Uncharacterized protein n=1 Tax=Ruminococcus turbiniformis TaxID=2881258 RepID=A0ABS8G2Q2_9FIRM|nr:hypothetical protein [Ruminococcus turbiniformis]MCC2255682.1 hypothetical protein [Ruminococcus turbiniformis]
MNQKELKKQIEWLESKVETLRPCGKIYYEVPESILTLLKSFQVKTEDSQKDLISRSALMRAMQEIRLDSIDSVNTWIEAEKLIEDAPTAYNPQEVADEIAADITENVDTQTGEPCNNPCIDCQNELTRKHVNMVLMHRKTAMEEEKNLHEKLAMLKINGNYHMVSLSFYWASMTETDYTDYEAKMENGIVYSGDYVGSVRIGNLAIDLHVYSPQQDGPITEDDEAYLTMEIYVGGVDTGYAYSKSGYPYDCVDDASYRFESALIGLTYQEFQTIIESVIIKRIQNIPYGKADLVKKATEKLHIF